jgi:hypothetical protein
MEVKGTSFFCPFPLKKKLGPHTGMQWAFIFPGLAFISLLQVITPHQSFGGTTPAPGAFHVVQVELTADSRLYPRIVSQSECVAQGWLRCSFHLSGHSNSRMGKRPKSEEAILGLLFET